MRLIVGITAAIMVPECVAPLAGIDIEADLNGAITSGTIGLNKYLTPGINHGTLSYHIYYTPTRECFLAIAGRQ